MQPSPASPDALRSSFQRVFLLRALTQGATAGLLLSFLLFLPIRLFFPLFSPLLLASFALLLSFLATLLSFLRSRSHIPTPTQCHILLESSSHAGGLLLSSTLPGAASWPTPPLTLPPLPRYTPGPRLALLPLSIALPTSLLLLPASLFQHILPPPPPPGLAPLITQTQERINDLLARDLLSPEDVEPLQEWLETLSSPSSANPSPESVTFSDQRLEALDHIHSMLDQKLAAQALPAQSLESALTSSTTTPPRSPQLESLNDSSRRLLESLASLDPTDPRCSTGSCENAQEALDQLLRENAEAQALAQALQSSQGSPTDAPDSPPQPGPGSGSGTPERGPGHAPLHIGDPTSPDHLPLQDSSLSSSAPNASLSDTTTIGISASEPNAPATPTATAPGALRPTGTPSGSTPSSPPLPRHRATIQHYFSP